MTQTSPERKPAALYLGIHTHRHGVSYHLFRVAEDKDMDLDDFITFLGEDFEPDRDDEWAELDVIDNSQIVDWPPKD